MDTTLRAILESNPTKSASVPAITIRMNSDTQENEETPATLCGWVPTPLEPPGPLAAILWKTHPEFRAGTLPVRRTILRDTIIKLQVRVEAELKGHRWSRKKIIEQLAAQQSADISPPQDTKELDAALAHLYEIQFVIVDEANKKVKWVPADVRTWSATKPVWGLSLGSRAVYHGPNEGSVATDLSKWVSDREQEKWSVAWPEADGTLEEIKKKIADLGLGSIHSGMRVDKPKKADYAAALGKSEAMRWLAEHFSGEAAVTEVML